MTTTLLMAVDGTPAAERAIEFLAGYRGHPSQIRVVAANVQTLPVTVWPEASMDVGSIEKALLAVGREVAERAVARLAASGLKAETAVRLGLPSDGIVHEARSCGAEMIVTGTRGHGALRGFALGSVAMRVAHSSPVPVCLVRPESKLPEQLGRKLRLMLAVDGSESALRAANALVSWRRWLGTLDVQIVYVQQPLAYLKVVLPPHDDVIGQWSREAGETAARPVRDLLAREGIPNHLHLTMGDPATELVHMADETGCELVVLGTRGLGAAHHAFIGSVALKVAAHVSVPAVLVK